MNDISRSPEFTESSALPNSWSCAALGDVCLDPQYGWTTSASNEGALPLVRTTDISSGSIEWLKVPFCNVVPPDVEKYTLNDGDILISRAGSVGKSFLIQRPKQSVFASYLIRFRPLIEGRYVNYFLQTGAYWNQISEATSGIAIPNVNANKLRRVELPVAPINEQARVADKIDELFSELDAGVASLKRARAVLKKYRQAVLKAAVTGELTRDWRERHRGQIKESGADLLQRILKERRRAWEAAELKKLRAKGKLPKDDHGKQKYKEPEPPDSTDLPPVPGGWGWASLDQLMTLVTSGSRGWKEYYADSGCMFIRAQNLRNDALDLSDVAYVDLPERAEGVRTRVMQNDILVTITGANVTKSALVNLVPPEAYVSQHVGLVRLAIRDCTRFVHSWTVCSSLGRKYLLDKAYGAGKPGLNLDNLRELALALPPSEEQEEINERLDGAFSNLDSLDRQIDLQLHQSAGLRQSILKAAFAGKLVPQDPDDEPASVLLERIRAERAARPKPARGRQRGTPAGRPRELLG